MDEKLWDGYNKLCDKIDAHAVVIMFDDGVGINKEIGRVVGRWYKSGGTHNLEMGIRLWGITRHPGEIYGRDYINTCKAGGGGYNKYKHCMEFLFSKAEDFINENYPVTIKGPEYYVKEYEGKKHFDWFNGWEEILKMTGFSVIKAL